ncbi:MAG: amino acid ABC transporter permease [Desulfovibrionaceae bacterium]
MMRNLLEKTWFQNACLFALFIGMAYYWGWVFDFGYKFQWSVLYVDNATYGFNFGVELLRGVVMTIKISCISSAVALALGTAFGLGRLALFAPVRWLSTAYVEFFRNTPLLIQLFFWYFAFPQALPEALRDQLFAGEFEFWIAVIGLSVYTGSFMAEVIRAGLQSIPKGLLEASYSSGLSYFQVLRHIILPLAFRAIIPPLGSEFLNNMKNSSLAMVVGVTELCWQSQQVESLTFKGFEATTAATVLYLSLSLSISAILNTVNRKLAIGAVAVRKPIHERVVDVCLMPVVAGARACAVVAGGVRRRSAMSESLALSPAMVAWRRAVGVTTRLLFNAAKALFVAAIAFVLYKAARAVIAFDWGVIRDNLGLLLIWRFPHGSPNELFWGLGGLAYSLLMAVIAITVSFFIGLVVGVGRTAKNRIVRIPCLLYIEIIRGNPLIIVIFWVYFFIPIVTGTFLDVFWSATVALTVFTGAYIAEIVRGGIQNIPPGQFEAAYSTGLTFFQVMRHIILPQALKQMIPAIVGQFIAIFKDTSLAYVIGVLELTFVAQGLNNRLMVHPFEIYTTVATLYFVCCYIMSQFAARLERRLSPEGTRLRM